jgi:ubiquinone/menaquinone biosynthesis C-methylase UbiE
MDWSCVLSSKSHWDDAYSSKAVADRSWSESGESDALAEVDHANLSHKSGFIDIGGGASNFACALVQRGFVDVTVLDISEKALVEARTALGDSAINVKWIVSDVLKWVPARTYDHWNDRAVFHFLVDEQDQQAYIGNVLRATRSGSHIVIATFSPDGPESCSGLPVKRWSQEDLANLFADSFSVVRSGERSHVTPWGSTQSFSWVHLQRL